MYQTPDLNEANQFIEAIAREGKVCFQTFDDQKDRRNNGSRVIPGWKYGSLSELSGWLIDENKKGAGIYILVNEGNGSGRSKEHITKVRAVFVDLDGAPITGLRKAHPIPNIVVESSPGRYHGYWLVEDCPLDKFSQIQSALAQRFNGDQSVKDLSRVMRVPGFLHKKHAAFISKLKYCNPNITFKTNELLAKLNIKLELQHTTNTDMPALDSGLRIPKGQRHSTLAKVAGRLRNTGFSKENLTRSLMDFNASNCVPPLDESEVRKIARWGNSKDSYAPSYVIPAPSPQAIFSKARTFKQLSETKLDPIQWVIKDVLPEGLCILAGKPKVGKSWLTQNWSLAVAHGGNAMGKFPTTKGQVLSLSLEDSERRFAARMSIMLCGKTAPENAHFLNEWAPMPHAATLIRQWLDEHGDTQLIIVDTLGKIQNKKQGKGNAYYNEYDDMASLQEITQEYRCAIVVVHHLRKGEADDDIESVSGTIGITGAADTVAILRRKDRSKRNGKLIIHGRDISEKYYDIEFQENTGLWVFKGSSSSDDNILSDIVHVLKDGIPKTKIEIAEALTAGGCSHDTVYKTIDSLLADKIISKSVAGRGKYVLATTDGGEGGEWDEQFPKD